MIIFIYLFCVSSFYTDEYSLMFMRYSLKNAISFVVAFYLFVQPSFSKNKTVLVISAQHVV